MVTKEETTTPEQMQNDYELMYIISPEVADDDLEPLIDNISQFIAGRGGIVSETARWGKKKLAYPIKHFLEGNYVLVKFKLNPSANRDLENNLRISEKILRHQLIKLD